MFDLIGAFFLNLRPWIKIHPTITTPKLTFSSSAQPVSQPMVKLVKSALYITLSHTIRNLNFALSRKSNSRTSIKQNIQPRRQPIPLLRNLLLNDRHRTSVITRRTEIRELWVSVNIRLRTFRLALKVSKKQTRRMNVHKPTRSTPEPIQGDTPMGRRLFVPQGPKWRCRTRSLWWKNKRSIQRRRIGMFRSTKMIVSYERSRLRGGGGENHTLIRATSVFTQFVTELL